MSISDNDIIFIKLNEFPETMKKSKLYNILKQQYSSSNPKLPIFKHIYERELILSNISDLSFIIKQLKTLNLNIDDIDYNVSIKNNNIILPYIYHLLDKANINKNKVDDLCNFNYYSYDYIYDVYILLKNSREKLLKGIIKHNRKTLFIYCLEHKLIEFNVIDTCEMAIKYKNMCIFKTYLDTKINSINDIIIFNIINICIVYGFIEGLYFINNYKKIIWTHEMCNLAIKHNQSKILEYIIENSDKYPWNELSFAYASEYGNVNIVKYLYEKKCPVDEISMLYASKNNNLEIIIYLHNKGIPLYSDTCLYSVLNNNIDMLMYAHFNNCNINSIYLPGKLCYYAVINNNINMLIYLINNGSIYNKKRLIDICIQNNNIDMFNYISTL